LNGVASAPIPLFVCRVFFGTTEQCWLNLQGAYEISRIKSEHANEIELIEPRAASAAR
jgi:plasmid maintenance system antidote protein VapI